MRGVRMQDRWVSTVYVGDVQIETFKESRGFRSRVRGSEQFESYGLTQKQSIFLISREIDVEIGDKVEIRLVTNYEPDVTASITIMPDGQWYLSHVACANGHAMNTSGRDLGSVQGIAIVESLGRKLNNVRPN
jgi:hypothetical protein